MISCRWLIPVSAYLVLKLACPVLLFAGEPTVKDVDFFEKKIRPVLVEQCYECHSSAAQAKKALKGGLLLDSKQGLLAGGDSGPALVPGKPKISLLIQALHHDGEVKMPPKGKLSLQMIADFETWVNLGVSRSANCDSESATGSEH